MNRTPSDYAEALPPEDAWYAWSGLRVFAMLTDEVVARMISSPHGLILVSNDGRYRASDLAGWQRCDPRTWRTAFTRDDAIALLVGQWRA